MKSTFVALAWFFVFSVTVYDGYFAWENRECFSLWELNPLARWIFQVYGLNVLFLFKSFLLGFALTVAGYCHLRRHYLEMPFTLVVSVVHILLSLHYLIGQAGSI